MILHKKFMFWNDWRFESIRGLKRVMNKPVKSSDNPIFDKSIIGYPKGGI